MAILELGINLGIRNILNIRYYDSDTGVGLRFRYWSGVRSRIEGGISICS